MAINITTNLVNTTGGKLSEVSAIQGSWQTVDTLADMNAFTASNAVKQNLKNGQIFYISSSGDFYKTTVTGAGLGATYSFDIFTGFGNASIPAGTISSSAQVISALPTGTVSGSSQLTSSYDSRYALSGSGGSTDLTSLNAFTSSADSSITALSAATSSYITSLPGGLVSGSEQLPAGLVSGSSQLTEAPI